MPYFNLTVFLLAGVAFAWIGFSSGRGQSSPKEYFRNPSLWKNAVSLVASNLTLGTGLVYLLSGSQQLGWWMLLAPVGLLAGYLLMARMMSARSERGETEPNLLAAMDKTITQATGSKSAFAKLISGVLALLMVILLAFEIFASTKVLCPLLLGGSSFKMEMLLSTMLLAGSTQPSSQ